MIDLGDRAASSVVRVPWNTSGTDGSSITRATNGSIRIYKNNSTTERSSSAGITDSEDFDTVTGMHHVNIDLSDNTDAGFYAAGNDYIVAIVGAVIDGKTVNAWLATFSIENRNIKANVTQWNSTNVATPDTAGYPKVTIKSGSGAGEVDMTSGVPKANVTQFGGSAGTFSSGRPEVNTSHFAGVLAVAPGSIGGPITYGTGPGQIFPGAGGVGSARQSVELIVNGDFTTALTSWTVGGSAAWQSPGQVTIPAFGSISQVPTLIVGRLYRLQVDVVSIGTTAAYITGIGTLTPFLLPGRNEFYFAATATGPTILITGVLISGADTVIDRVSLVEVKWEQPVYSADINWRVDNANTDDLYEANWSRNGIPITSGITSPTIQVVRCSNGVDIIGSTAMTQVGSTGAYRYTDTSALVKTAAEDVLVIVGATIDGVAWTDRIVRSRDT